MLIHSVQFTAEKKKNQYENTQNKNKNKLGNRWENPSENEMKRCCYNSPGYGVGLDNQKPDTVQQTWLNLVTRLYHYFRKAHISLAAMLKKKMLSQGCLQI